MLESSPKQHSRRDTKSLSTTTSVEHEAKEELLENDVPIDLSKKSSCPIWKNKDTQGSSEKTNFLKSIESDWIEKWQKIAGGVLPPMFSSYLHLAEDPSRTHWSTLNHSDKLSYNSKSASFLSPFLFPVGTLNSCPLVCDPFGNTFILTVHPDDEHIVPVPIGSPFSNGIKLTQTDLTDTIPVSDKLLSKYLENSPDEKGDQSSKNSTFKTFSRSSNNDEAESEQEENTCPEKNDQRDKLKSKDSQSGSNESKYTSFLYSKEKCSVIRELSQEHCDVAEDLRVSKDTNRLENLARVEPQLRDSHFFGNLKNSVSCSVLSEKSPGVDHFWCERPRTNSESAAFRKHPIESVVEDAKDKEANSNETLKRKVGSFKSESEFDHLNPKRHKISLRKSKSEDMNLIDSKRNDQTLFAVDLEHYKSKDYFSSAQNLASVSIDTSECRGQEKTFFQHLRHIYPLSFPWNIYGYYSKLMQTCQNSEVFTHLAARNISITSDGAVKTPSPKSSPSFAKTTSHENSGIVNDSQSDTWSASAKKRVPRTLTGKHVRYGTGASLSTLQTLREKIHERQKAKEHTVLNEKLFSSESNKKKSNSKQPTKRDRSPKTKTKIPKI
ncbi:uncharacterized protein LOC106461565 [Limulus polyphemus]|uniref:Uncharacterized protein LOC106461565 n=1 Tax=Limulus polyphemus TaxID=6850 RepID=A0ABM1B8B5_LIMPO|nr:uncharacterized protein LOC106461565 [Limulus polyphemus]XP_013776856.1 uncharacterized protein LOC106461565 [Limulus polyphemus]XP_013776857.1 uncharacterized protein LOC106461565 [Limulus polyphemus]XP_022244266.1 uncharacterized protein LOC106461565 [Limulus polyphemus]XP_022244267.1 uncharacterized protein LOC106461565 [Limulus polyphemus]